MEPGYPNLIHSRKGEAGKQLLFGWLPELVGWMVRHEDSWAWGWSTPPPRSRRGEEKWHSKKVAGFQPCTKMRCRKKTARRHRIEFHFRHFTSDTERGPFRHMQRLLPAPKCSAGMEARYESSFLHKCMNESMHIPFQWQKKGPHWHCEHRGCNLCNIKGGLKVRKDGPCFPAHRP